MYAIVETGGKQYRVKPGDTLAVERLSGEPGETLDLARVLMIAGNGDSPRVGTPGVAGAVVRAEVLEHFRGEKIVVFRYKSKVRYRRKTGHRQSLTRLRITDILVDGESTVRTAEPESTPEPVVTTGVADDIQSAVEPTANVIDDTAPEAASAVEPEDQEQDKPASETGA